jgi:hypothetical protein
VAVALELLEVLNVESVSGAKFIELYRGDLTALEAPEAVDINVVSAYQHP